MGYYGGLTITGSNSFDNLGRNVTNVGDINGDGIDDIAVTTQNPVAYYGDQINSRGIYVIFGDNDGALPAEIDVSDLDGTNGFQITIATNGFYGNAFSAGSVLANVGDLNNDGIDDLGIGGLRSSNFAQDPTAFVLFGDAGGFEENVSVGSDMDGSTGFSILADEGNSITNISSAGDVNGDGIDDLLLGQGQSYSNYNVEFASTAGNGPNVASAATATNPIVAYVIFGEDGLDTGGSLDVSTTDGTNGFGVEGGLVDFNGYYGEIGYVSGSGGGVISLGDVNGDGFADLGLQTTDFFQVPVPDDNDGDGNPDLDENGNYTYENGQFQYDLFSNAYVLFGNDTTGPNDAFKTGMADGTQVFWDDLSQGITSADPYDLFYINNITGAGIGDINGDGYDDVAIGTDNRVLLGEFSPVAEDGDDARGVIGIIYGGPDGVDTDGDGPEDGLNSNVSLAARLADGSPSNPPDVTIVNSIEGFTRGFGVSFEAAGDVNGDGIDDLLITNPNAPDANGNSYYGETFLVLGKDSAAGEALPTVLDLDNLSQGEIDQTFYRFFQDDERFSSFGGEVSAAGDLNGDGFGDLIIGDPNADVYDQTYETTVSNAGKAYVIFGGSDALEAADNADGANDNSINVANLNVNALTGAVPIVVSVTNTGFQGFQLEGTGGVTEFNFEVQRTGDLTEEVSFTYSVAGSGFSQADADDFESGVLPSGSVTFASGDSKATVIVPVNADADIESSEDFTFTLESVSTTGSSDVSLGVAQSFGRITNDDFPASVRVSSTFITEGEDIVFEVTRFNDLSSEVSVDFVTGTGFNTAEAADITGGAFPSGTVTFGIGEKSKQIVLGTVDDLEVEGQEFVRVVLSNVVSDGAAVLSNSTAFGYITDNDFAPEIFVQGGGSFNEGSTPGGFTPVTFEIIRRGDTDGVTEVVFDLNPVPAPGDFFAADSQDIDSSLPNFGNVVRFEDGESVKQVTVNIIHDGIIEPREQFELRITQVDALNGTDYNILNSSSTVTIRNDDGRPPIIPDGVEADVFGDPHIVTLDGLGYDFQAVGEYILVESTIDNDPRDFNVQVRFEPLPGSDLVSVTTRMSVDVGGKTIEIDALNDSALLIDGVAVSDGDLSIGAIDVDGDGTYDVFLDENQSEFFIVLNDLNEQLMVKNMDGVLNICVFLSEAEGGHANNVIGLMGNANGDTSDDLTTRDGSVTYTDPTFEELYVDYADSWKVTREERNFSDAEGSGVFPDAFPAAKITIADLPDAVLADAIAAVDEAGITDEIIREAAILDFALTGDDSFVQGALGLAADPTEEINVTETPELPLSIGVTPGDTSVSEADGNPNTLFFTFYRIGDDSEAVVIDYAIGGDVDAADLVAGTPTTGQVTLAAGVSSTTLAVGVVDDALAEGTEDLIVSITGNDKGALVASANGKTVIQDDDFAPEAVDDVFSTSEDDILTGNVLAANPAEQDSDADGDTLTVISATASNGDSLAVDGSSVTLASGAVVQINADGTFEYDPTGAGADFNSLSDGDIGTETFTYEISDGNGGTDTATVSINVTGVNDAPVGVDDEATTDADTAINIDVADNDTDGEGDDLNAVAVDDTGTIGSVSVNDDGTVDYDPNGAFSLLQDGETATDTFTYTVSDGDLTDTATVEVEIEGTFVPPTPTLTVSLDPSTIAENAGDEAAIGTVTRSDTAGEITVMLNNNDPSEAFVPVTVTLADGEASATFEISAVDDMVLDGDQTATITASANGYISGSADLVVTDDEVANTAPVANDDSASTSENTPIIGNVITGEGGLTADTDADEDSLTVVEVKDSNGNTLQLTNGNMLPEGGELAIGTDGAFSFDPLDDFDDLGADNSVVISVTYTISDGAEQNDATVEITVNGVNDAPVLGEIPVFEVDENTVAVGSITASDVDSEGLNFSIIGGADEDLLSINAVTGALSFNSAPDFEDETHSPSYEVEVEVTDGELTDTAVVSIQVQDVDEDPNTEINNIFGTEDRDRLDGTDGTDNIVGFGGSDQIDGAAGEDVINAGAGNDYNVRGGADADIFEFGIGDDIVRILDFEDGVDQIRFTGGLSIADLSISQGATSVNVFVGPENDRLIIFKGEDDIIDVNDFMFTGEPPEVVGLEILGTEDRDRLNGTSEGDTIEGFGSADQINGGGGDDIINAGGGNDYNIRGGQGADIFEFGVGSDIDRVLDFEDGVDLIQITGGLSFEDLDVRANNNVFIGDDRLIVRSDDAVVLSEEDFLFVDNTLLV